MSVGPRNRRLSCPFTSHLFFVFLGLALAGPSRGSAQAPTADGQEGGTAVGTIEMHTLGGTRTFQVLEGSPMEG